MSEPEAIQWVEREGRHIAMLGVIEAGDVVNWHGNAKWCGAYCRLFLPQVRTYKLFGAKDIAAGRRAVEEAVLIWIEAAGLAPATARETAMRAWRTANDIMRGES